MTRRAALLPIVVALYACSSAPAPDAAPAPVIQAPAAATVGPPSTDIYLIRLTGDQGSLPVVNITNRAGYDNQPSWEGNSKVLYTAQQPDGQTDIFRFDLATSSAQRLTATAESEYSPAVTPSGSSFSVVRVELDSTQRIWRFPISGEPPEVVLPDVKPVGYFAWLDTTTLALFVLGSPNTLRIADTRTGSVTIAASRIGRSLQRVPGGRKASFLHRVGERWVLKTVDPEVQPDGSFRIDSIAVMPDSAEYVVWRSANELYTAAGTRLFRMRLPRRQWAVAADFGNSGVRGISRLALSPDGARLAVVAEEPVRSP